MPADLGPALDAVAGVGRASGGSDPLGLVPEFDLTSVEPVSSVEPLSSVEPVAPVEAPGPRWGAGPVVETVPEAEPWWGGEPPTGPKQRWGTGQPAWAEPRPAWGVEPEADLTQARDAEPVAGQTPAREAEPAADPAASTDPDPTVDLVAQDIAADAEPAAHPAPVTPADRATEPELMPTPIAESDTDPERDTESDAAPVVEAGPVLDRESAAGRDGVGLRKPCPDGGGLPEGVAELPEDVVRVPVSTPRPPEEERAPVTMTVGAADPVAWWGAGRRQPVISTETTAPIPVHLLFRDDDHSGGTAATRVVQRPGAGRPPVPRSSRMRTTGRPAPLADPRLAERPGPVLPGWAALLTAAAGTAAGLAVLWWHGALPAAVTDRLGIGARAYEGVGTGAWALIALLVTVALFALGGLGRGRVGYASVLTLFGDYRGSVRRTGLLWISPLLLRRRVDVRLRHWRSEPLPAVDASGTSLRVVVLVVWRVKDTVRATFGVADHECYLRDQVEAALARVLSQLPADAFHEDTRTLRDAEAVGDALTRVLRADCEPVGIEVYSAQPTGIEYAPEVAAAMQRCRVAAIDAKHRDGVLTSVVDAVDDTVGRLTARGIVELDAYEHKALVRDLTVAFYTGRSGTEGA
ncbi:SPFH domain-containing protein [Streptomyces sp. NPDC006288]|uniref:SPFH domain-containing protein n=1 Tax=Streptomyces sp. NPDC006288 TaxID=3156743 RepID=UPI0033AA20E1